jgi:hypothetical protein
MDHKLLLEANKIKVMLIGITIFLLANNLFAQAPEILWQKTWGRQGYAGNSQDIGYSVQQTIDGGYIIKTDANGDTLWTNSFGGTAFDRGQSVQQTIDGGYIIAGETRVGSSPALYLIKTDTNGNELWTKVYGGTCDCARSVQQTADSGYIAAGQLKSAMTGGVDVWLVKTDESGDTLWTMTYGGDSLDQAWSVQQTTDSGYIIAGRTYSFGPGNLASYPNGYLIRTDANGDTLWTRVYGGIYSDELHSVKQTPDGSYIVTGWTRSYGAGGCDVWLIKTDADGDTLWTKTYGGTSNDEGLSIQRTSDGNYIIAGWTILPGHTESDVYLIKTDAQGYLLWELTCGTTNGPDIGQSVQQTTDNGYIIAGQYTISLWNYDVYLIKTGPDLCIEENPTIKPRLPYAGLKVFPNPFRQVTEIRIQMQEVRSNPSTSLGTGMQDISLKIYDAAGCLVKSFNLTSNILSLASAIVWDGSNNMGHQLPAGVYFVRLTTPRQTYTEEVILLK